MEITQTFVNTYGHMLRAKLSRFWQRSIYRYALGVALITLAVHGSDPTMSLSDKLVRGAIYFCMLCCVVFLILILSAWLQSRHIVPRTITFSEHHIVETQNGEVIHRGWDWILQARGSEKLLELTLDRMPRLVLYLPWTRLSPEEVDTLYAWLETKGKLAATSTPR